MRRIRRRFNRDLIITSTGQTLLIKGDIGTKDASGEPTDNHTVGLEIANYSDIKGPDGNTVNALQDGTKRPPVQSGEIIILPPEAAPKVRPPRGVVILAPDGFPSFIKVDSSGNFQTDKNGKYLADTSYGRVAGEDSLDIDGDGKPDTIDVTGTGRKDQIDIDGDGRADVDLNKTTSSTLI